MQELELSRGKREDNGEWVYGYYTPYGKSRGLHPAIITGTEEGCVIPAFIIPSTLGQCTGLTDKNNTKIYEGDVVKCSKESSSLVIVGVVKYGRYTDVDSVDSYEYLGWYLEASNQCISILQPESEGMRIEVVGNIHNNTTTEGIPNDKDLLPNKCLYIKGYLGKDSDGVIAVADKANYDCYSYYSIIDEIEDYAEVNGVLSHTDQGLGGRHSIIEKCNMRAYFTKSKTSLYEAQTSLINVMYGGDMQTKVSYTGYSEYTIIGLDLDEFTVGGHDLAKEFHSHIGEYVHLIIEC